MADGMKERILGAALEMIQKRGISGFSLEEVSDYLGISRKTIYNHFKNKKNLLLAAIDLNLVSVGKELDELAERNDIGFIEKLERIVEIAFIEIRNWEDASSSAGSFFWGHQIGMPIPAIRRKILELVTVLVEEGVQEGVLRDDIPLEILPYYYMNLVEGAVRLYDRKAIPIERAEFLRESLKISFKGVLTPAGAGLIN